MKGMRW